MTLLFFILNIIFSFYYSIDVAILDQDCEGEDGAGLQHDGDVEDSTDLQCASASSTTQQSAVSNSEVKTSPTKETAGVEFGPYVRFSGLYQQQNYKKELATIKSTKIICSLDLLLEQFMGECPSPGCLQTRKINYSIIGTCLIVRWECPSGHRGRFSSSRELNGLWANNIQTAAAVVLSGNNYSKVARFAEFLGLSFISNSTHHRMQRLYCIPAIDEWWEWMRGELIEQFRGEKLVLCGDGQCDSPGFSAKNLCYFLMELVSEYILEVEVVDKRHVDMKSTAMEKKALQQSLTRLKQVLDVVEISTDASVTIKKLIGEL